MAKNDSKLLTKVSSLIPGQVPDFIETDHTLFVKFLKDYYQFLEAGRITLSTTINYVTLETTTVSYVLNETDETRIVTEIGEGTLGQFIEGETITGGTSGASATTAASSANSLGDFDNQYISIEENIIGIKGVIPFFNETNKSTNMFSVDYQYALNDLYTFGGMQSFKNYVFTQQRLSMINNLFNTMPRFRFNRHTDRLHLDVNWGEDVDIDDFIVAEAYIIADPSTFSDVFGDMFLKKYVTALFKKQWGQNLIKFEGLQLPGGVTLNGRQLYDDATTEIDRIEEEVQLKYQLPDDFFVG